MKSMILKCTQYLLFILVLSAPATSLADDQWTLSRSSKGILIYSRTSKNSPVLAFRGKLTINAPPQKILRVLCDSDLQTDWVRNLKESRILKRIDAHECYVYQHYSLPWYVTDRDFVIHFKASKDKRGLLHIRIKSIDLPIAPKTIGIRAKIISSHFTLERSLDGKKTHITLEIEGDPKGLLPNWLKSDIQKNWAFNTLKDLRSQSMKRLLKPYPLPKKK
jgi:hypothetical protein